MRHLLLCLCLLLPLAAIAQDNGQPAGPIGVEASPTTDAAIATRIRSILGELDGMRDVTVTVSEGIVTLRGEVADTGSIARVQELAARVEGVVAVENGVSETTELGERLNPAWHRLETRALQSLSFLPLFAVSLGVGVLIFLLGLFIASRRQPWDRLAPNLFIADIYRAVVRIAFGVLGIVLALDILGATALLGTILGAAGIIGLAIGFAVKDTVENFLASVLLSIRQPFQPNDVIEIAGDLGKVIRLTSRATILLSFDGNHIRIPNATVFKSRIVNYTRNKERRFLFAIGVEAESDLAAVRALIEETVSALPYTLSEPAPAVWIEDLNESGAVFTVTGWIDQHETSIVRARGEAIRLVKRAIEVGGYAIPDTTYRIRLDGIPGIITETDAPPQIAAPEPSPVAGPADVQEDALESEQEAALDKLIETERADRENPDLLRQNAPQE